MNKKFNVLDFFFDWNGRIGRKEFWFGLISLSIISIPFTLVFFISLSDGLFIFDSSYNQNPSQIFIYFLPSLIFISILSFAQTVLYIKRYHDRNKSGHWLWIWLIPYLGAIWIAVEAGFFRGTIGENKFGKDPVKED
jgi:hypothetical protein